MNRHIDMPVADLDAGALSAPGRATGTQAGADLAACHEAIRTGSYSFHAASRLLPVQVRDRAIVLYAFCRLADDAVDDSSHKAAAVLSLHERLDLAYAGRPRNAPADRAFAGLVAQVDMPRALPEALIEGLAWDAEGRSYATLSDLCAYAARVASAVGAMMCVLMDVRDEARLARACDLGLAMQLTNIARDVGEDARAGRLYLPRDWLDEAGIDPAILPGLDRAPPELAALVARLLDHADAFYRRSEPGIAALPPACRPGIMAARLVYDGIGTALRRLDHDSIAHRARTSGRQKLGWLALAALRSAGASVMPHSATLHAPAAPETVFLVRAATRRPAAPDRSERLLEILSTLRAYDMAQRQVDRRRSQPM
jgi:15-cis-phytoene synthase